MARPQTPAKYMTLGEGGTAVAFAALAVLSIVIAAKAYTSAYAFHAYLFAAASVAAIFAIANRYFERSDAPVPLMIDGKPNYNMGPVKLATMLAVFWGIAGFAVGLWLALELAFPALNFDLSFISFGRLRPLAHLGGHIRVWRQRADRHVVLCGAADLPGAARGRSRAVVRRARLQFLYCDRRHRLSARYYPIEGIRRARMVFRSLAYHRVGRVSARLSRHHYAANRAAHLCRQLVLSRLHSHHRGPASRQQCRGAGVAVLAEILHRLVRRAGCDGAVVVRAQRRRLLPHRRLPRHHVLFHSQSAPSGRSTPIGCRSSISGRSSSSTSGRARITCTTPRCRTGRRRWA